MQDRRNGSSSLLGALRAQDPHLPLLASQAAIEIDAILREVPVEPTATKRLAVLLTNSFQRTIGGTGYSSLADPTTLVLMTAAFGATPGSPSPRTTTELAEEASRVAASLNITDANVERETLKRVRAFCAALSECAAAYLQSINDYRPQHPYRR